MRICVCGACIHIPVCLCLCVCVYDCLGSQRVTEPEFDEGTAVVSKGGWGPFPSVTMQCVPELVFSSVVLFWCSPDWHMCVCIN